MFTNTEQRLIKKNYFTVIRETENFIEIQSKETQHCWIIQKNSIDDSKYLIILHHKHSSKDLYYHKHFQCTKVIQAINNIKRHDNYVLTQLTLF